MTGVLLQENRRYRYDAPMNSNSQSSSGRSDGVVLTTQRMMLRAVSEADILPLHEKIFSSLERPYRSPNPKASFAQISISKMRRSVYAHWSKKRAAR
jgi:hypothetical protein